MYLYHVLDPGEVCDVSVMFTPQSAGSLSANLVVTNNHLNGNHATQNVAVSGVGVKPSPSITLESSRKSCTINQQRYAHGNRLFLSGYANRLGRLL